MRKSLLAITVLAFAVGGSGACATKKFVNTQVGQVSGKVDTLSQSLEQTQERTRQNEAKIGEVDQKAQAAQGSANQAQQAASQADQKAVAAGESARMASTKVEELDKNSKRIMYEVVLSESSGAFKFNKVDLPDETKAKIDQLVSQIKADPKGAYFEIEGHTDNVGDAKVNEKIGLARAEAVKRYLYEQHQIPLHRMNVISYGETKPATDNKTRDNRAENRRVVIRVLA
jgi:outer membrane protein OmpA-like peptidoglycan-associated protein